MIPHRHLEAILRQQELVREVEHRRFASGVARPGRRPAGRVHRLLRLRPAIAA